MPGILCKLHDKDGRARHLGLDLEEEGGELLPRPGLPYPLAPAPLRGLDHHRVPNTLCHLDAMLDVADAPPFVYLVLDHDWTTFFGIILAHKT